MNHLPLTKGWYTTAEGSPALVRDADGGFASGVVYIKSVRAENVRWYRYTGCAIPQGERGTAQFWNIVARRSSAVI